MGSNSFGKIFTVTTWGESHGKAIGAVIDGCPAGVAISEEEIYQELQRRRGGTPYTTPRKEKDLPEILSGVFEGKTTGAPISIIIYNHDVKSASYEPVKDMIKPGHAGYTYLSKYGIHDYRGGGRASARETACRVAAGAIAKKILRHHNIGCRAFIKMLGGVEIEPCYSDALSDPRVKKRLDEAISSGDSLGAVIECVIDNVPKGLGEPVYEKLQAVLSKAMLSIPACKGIEFGSGFAAASMMGSLHNDEFFMADDGAIQTRTNNAGGLLGGISNGMPIVFRLAMKPTSSIFKKQNTLTYSGEKAYFEMPEGSRHDPCVALRAIPVVEAMAALVITDALLMMKLSRIDTNYETDCSYISKPSF